DHLERREGGAVGHLEEGEARLRVPARADPPFDADGGAELDLPGEDVCDAAALMVRHAGKIRDRGSGIRGPGPACRVSDPRAEEGAAARVEREGHAAHRFGAAAVAIR